MAGQLTGYSTFHCVLYLNLCPYVDLDLELDLHLSHYLDIDLDPDLDLKLDLCPDMNF